MFSLLPMHLVAPYAFNDISITYKKKISLLGFLVVHDSDLKISLIRLVKKILMKCEV
jgi:hypothetical protein